jgi:ferritin-like metal-binding protein YciE
MAPIDSLRTLLVMQLKDIYDAEKRLTKAIPRLIKKSTNDQLVAALENHLDETQEQVSRIERMFEHLDEPAKGKTCVGMKGLIDEGEQHLGKDFEDDGLRDATVIGAAQRVKHYEMAAYGTAIAHARLLELDDVVNLLEQTLDEEKAADIKLTDIAESVVNLDAAEGDQGMETMSRRGGMPARSIAIMSARTRNRAARDRGRSRKGSSRGR